MDDFRPGLEGVVAAKTRLSMVDGERGELVIGGFPVGTLAERATFEEVVYLLWNDAQPTPTQIAEFRAALAECRPLPSTTMRLLEEAVRHGEDPMDALRMAVSTLSLAVDGNDRHRQALVLVGAIPTIVAAYARLREGREPIAPREDLGHAANFLHMLGGDPEPVRVRALNAYLVTVCDHGLNASTFTARVIISTESDMISAVTGAIGALKGPLHGGAPGPALDMVHETVSSTPAGGSTLEVAERVIRAKLEAGERLMGFGHRVYKVRDPRADVLAKAVEDLYHDNDAQFYAAAREVEAVALRLLEEYKPGRRLQTNVEFYTALLLHGIGVGVDDFTPIFASARVAGWTAHCLEQLASNRLYRPQSEYVGELGRQWDA